MSATRTSSVRAKGQQAWRWSTVVALGAPVIAVMGAVAWGMVTHLQPVALAQKPRLSLPVVGVPSRSIEADQAVYLASPVERAPLSALQSTGAVVPQLGVVNVALRGHEAVRALGQARQ